jgi:hypothetical protein
VGGRVKALITAFASSALVGALLGSLSNGCSGDCECAPFPTLPEPSAPKTIVGVASYDARGETAALPIDPSGGTLELTGDRIIIRYATGESEHLVTYRIEPLR